MGRILRLCEYERLYRGEHFDPITRTVTAAQHRALERFDAEYRQRKGIGIFQHGPRGSLIAQNFVGVIQLGDHQVEILPKIDAEQAVIRNNLSRMIAVAHGLDLHDGGASQMAAHQGSILDIFIELFCRQLWAAVRAGLVRRYQGRRENLAVLRGRLDINAQIRDNLARQDRLACVYDEFTDDNPVNRALKAALKVLLQATKTPRTGAQLAELLFCFADVTDQEPRGIHWSALTVDRLGARYRPLLSLARLFVEGRSPDVLVGDGSGFALLFDMNELFESYVGQQLRRLLRSQGMRVFLQGPQRTFARSTTSSSTFQLRPDIVVSAEEKPRCIVDTKWKRLREERHREGVSSGDAYQMFAYAQRYEVEQVLLLYPHHPDLGPWRVTRAQYCFESSTDKSAPLLGVATIDLSDLGRVPEDLAAIMRSVGLSAADQHSSAEQPV